MAQLHFLEQFFYFINKLNIALYNLNKKYSLIRPVTMGVSRNGLGELLPPYPRTYRALSIECTSRQHINFWITIWAKTY